MLRKNLLTPLALLALATGAGAADSGQDVRGNVRAADGPVVVWIEGLAGEVVEGADTPITHVAGGQFEPAVSVGFVGNRFIMRNDDDTLHNVHLMLELSQQKEVSSRPLNEGATLYNIALPLSGMEVVRPIRPYHEHNSDTGAIKVVCNAHPEERAWVLVFDHPFAAVTGPGGEFSLAGVPPGQHALWMWHGGQSAKWGTVDVKSGAPTKVVVDVSALGAAE